ncbi:MAG TPA: QueG-associated DUF1730 domain-containing protein [Bacteriovoracaceae bacterium]|nr:QueG-associated DUF1730 domain-containing protein [Bacteriovoracaceae bacterium]
MNHSDLFSPELLDSLGVLDWGYTEEALPRSYEKFESWVAESRHTPLTYLSDHRRDLRKDLRSVYPEFKSALVFIFSYQATKKWMNENSQFRLAAYTLGFEGEDYHQQLRARLATLKESLQLEGLGSFVSLDAEPVLERDLAHRAGLGWFAKNSMLIHQKHGSYFLIGSLLLDRKLDLSARAVDVDHCGQCTACAEACPTAAIDLETRTLISSRCISTFTIETFKEAEPPAGFENSRGEVFGCDICQDVCPWNRRPLERVTGFLRLNASFEFLRTLFLETPREKLRELINSESNRSFKRKLRGTALDRPGRVGWLKNLR